VGAGERRARLVGPGSHPPEERRFTEHPDWARVMRIFSGRVDVTLYLAPFLDKKGFSGALSKRMDGVLIATSVRRSSRAALRDAFLELWGSDAPMIGYLAWTCPTLLAPPVIGAFARGALVLGEVESSKSLDPRPPPGGAAAGRRGRPHQRAGFGTQTFRKPQGYGSEESRLPGITRAHVTVPAQRPNPGAGRGESRTRCAGSTCPARPSRRADSRALLRILWGALLLITLAGAGAWVRYQPAERRPPRGSSRDAPSGTEPMLPEIIGAQTRSAPGGQSRRKLRPSASFRGRPGWGARRPPERIATGQEILPYLVHVASFRSKRPCASS